MPAIAPAIKDQPATDLAAFSAAFAAVDSGAPVVFVTGRAGTGKTTFIRELLKDKETKQVVLAFTGVAALNVGGQTIHSFFQIPPRMQNLSEIKPVPAKKRQIIRNLERLVIDEISMVRADLLDQIDHALKVNRESSLPFGGVQVLMVGDFYQLPPVLPRAEAEMLRALGYESRFALSALCLRHIEPRLVELGKVFRQTDSDFIDLLGKVRNGTEIAETVARFNDMCLKPHRDGQVPVLLTGRNAEAEAYNVRKLKELPGEGKLFEGKITGEFKLEGDQLPAPMEVELKPGARVMMLKNDPQKRWVNGSLATVTRLTDTGIAVKFDNKYSEYDITPATWERYKYAWNSKAEQIESEVTGSYTQIPVKLAWASTIHKAQGLSLDDVRINLASGAFESGQVYVALSRATSLAGLSLDYPLAVAHIMKDPRIDAMLARLSGTDQLEQQPA